MLLRRVNNKTGGEGFGFCPDVWNRIEDDAPIPDEGAVLVSAARWLQTRETLARRRGDTGALLEPDGDVEALGRQCHGLALIALRFPRFQDGRAYSQARLLRERYGFCGELRATGNVLRDQLAFMQRCGFDAFEVDEQRIQLADVIAALGEMSVCYQPAGDGRIPAWQLRARRVPEAPALAAAGGAR